VQYSNDFEKSEDDVEEDLLIEPENVEQTQASAPSTQPTAPSVVSVTPVTSAPAESIVKPHIHDSAPKVSILESLESDEDDDDDFINGVLKDASVYDKSLRSKNEFFV